MNNLSKHKLWHEDEDLFEIGLVESPPTQNSARRVHRPCGMEGTAT